jgi:hypothetical protein
MSKHGIKMQLLFEYLRTRQLPNCIPCRVTDALVSLRAFLLTCSSPPHLTNFSHLRSPLRLISYALQLHYSPQPRAHCVYRFDFTF